MVGTMDNNRRRVAFAGSITVVDDSHCSVNCMFLERGKWWCAINREYLESEDIGPLRTDACKYREMYFDYLYMSGLLPGRDDRPKLPKVRGLNGEDLYGEWIKSKDKGQP